MDAKKPEDLVEKLLNEAPGDVPPGSPGRMARGETTNAAGERVAGDFQRPGDDDAGDDDDDGPDEVDFHGEEEFAEQLSELIEENIPGARVSSFREAGVLTQNEGLVVRTPNGSFQVTIVEDRRRY